MNEFMKKYVIAYVVLGLICYGVVWMNGKFDKTEKDLAVLKTELEILRRIKS